METEILAILMRHDKDNPFVSKLIENRRLNKSGSIKDTRHVSLSIANSGLTYQPGDALCIYPKNDNALVEELLSLISHDLRGQAEFVRFSELINITRPSNKLFTLLESKIQSLTGLAERFEGHSTVSVLKTLMAEYPELRISGNELAEHSSKLQARAYSIASSQRVHPEEVQLCVSRVEQDINGQKVLGICSNYLLDRVPLHSSEVKVYFHSNDKFRLPEDPTKDIIMVGPGTGIAPFRSFIEERNALRKSGLKVGRDWLFFGDQHKEHDFLYEDELKSSEDKYGLRLTTAFSRDQEAKIYVQDRLREQSQELMSWLRNGAYFYVCGDARRMAKDVDTALREILSAQGEDSETYMNLLKAEKRYCRDVY